MNSKIKPPKKRRRSSITFNIKKRIVAFDGTLVLLDVATFIAGFEHLMQDPDLEPITIKIKSGRGGTDFTTMALHYLVRSSVAPTIGIVEKLASSAHTDIFLATEQRIMKRNAKLVFHWINISEYIEYRDLGEEPGLERCLHFVRTHNAKTYKMIHESTGIDIELIKYFYEGRISLDAQQALDYNLIHEIVD